MTTNETALNARALTTPGSAAVSGVVFAVIFTTSIVLLQSSVPEDPFADPSWAETGTDQLTVALTLMPLAGIAFLWFMGVVRDLQGDLEDRFFSTVYFGSGLLFLAMIFVSTAIGGAILLTVSSDTTPAPSPEIVTFARAQMIQVTSVFALRMAGVFMISLGSTWHRTAVMPRWLVLCTYLLALCLLVITSLSIWVALVFPAWVFTVSVFVLVTARRSRSQPARA
jgi:hypothetical protein